MGWSGRWQTHTLTFYTSSGYMSKVKASWPNQSPTFHKARSTS
jgi:hypothetical protein